MKAAVFRRYGPPDVVRIEEVKRPRPKAGEVLVRVAATTVSAADWRIRKADPFLARLLFGLFRPRIRVLGVELAGTVVETGRRARRFRPGDEVFGIAGIRFGAHAEYVCVAEVSLEARPANISIEEAAAIPFGGMTALYFLNRAGVRPGQKVLVYGASGAVGVAAVQLAKHLGAQVTAVCSTANLDLVRALGADATVDYTRQDFAKAGRVYDVVFDAVGKARVSSSLRALKRGGAYVMAAPPPGSGLALQRARMTGAARVLSGVARLKPGDLGALRTLVETGALRPVIDRRCRLDDIVEAHRYAEAGHKTGSLLVLVPQTGIWSLPAGSQTATYSANGLRRPALTR